MKAWFDWCHLFHDDWSVRLGIDWFVHAKPNNSRFKPWRGITFTFFLLKYIVFLNIVDDYEAHQARMNYKRDPDHMKKLGDKLKVLREKK